MAPKDSAKSRWWHGRTPHAAIEPAPAPVPGPEAVAARKRARVNAARATMAAVPVVMVNSAAFIGQFAFIRTHLALPYPFQVLFAATLETVAVFLAWHAHIAQMRNDSASRLKGGAYSFALVMGGMNYSHWAAHWHPTVTAVGMALMSALSPWLWGIHTRRASRDALMAEGLVEKHAVRLGATRWTWHPVRSWRVMYWATWHGINEPARAITHFAGKYGTPDEPALARSGRKPAIAPVAVTPLAQPSQAARVPWSNWRAPVPDGTHVAALAPHAPAPGPAGAPPVPPLPAPVAQEAASAPPSGPEQHRLPRARALPLDYSGDEGEGGNPPDVIHGRAALEAEPRAWNKRKRPRQELIDGAELTLAATPLDQLPSIRFIAEGMLEDPNQRRLAEKLLKARKAAGSSLSEAPSSENVQGNGAHHARRLAPGMIAPPNGFQPGGNQ